MQHDTVTADDGERLHVRVSGNGPPLLLLHGWTSSHASWAPLIEPLGQRHRLLRPDARVFGTRFLVEGDVASPCVFYLTDSTDNFLYGALYFDAPPNADSLAPVTERLRADIDRFAATLRWSGQ